MVSANLLGYPYTVVSPRVSKLADLDRVDPKVFLRYLQLSSVMPVMNIAFAPWNITDPAVAASCKAIVNDRARLGAYYEQLVSGVEADGRAGAAPSRVRVPAQRIHRLRRPVHAGVALFDPRRCSTARTAAWYGSHGVFGSMLPARRYRGPLVTTVTASNDHVLYFESEKNGDTKKQGN
ncbi:MAG: hypothetical protein ACLR8Y_01215 [Alistipes indistinctus]